MNRTSWALQACAEVCACDRTPLRERLENRLLCYFTRQGRVSGWERVDSVITNGSITEVVTYTVQC